MAGFMVQYCSGGTGDHPGERCPAFRLRLHDGLHVFCIKTVARKEAFGRIAGFISILCQESR